MPDYPNRDDIFKGISAQIVAHVDNASFRWYSEWQGPQDGLAAISTELMRQLHPDAHIGDEVELGKLKVQIVDFNNELIGNYWTVKRA